MGAEIIDINERARDAWDAYLAAKDRAEETREFRDARRAGIAWGRFLDLFSREGREESRVLRFRQGAAR